MTNGLNLTFVRKSFNKPFELVSTEYGIVMNVEFIVNGRYCEEKDFEKACTLDNMFDVAKRKIGKVTLPPPIKLKGINTDLKRAKQLKIVSFANKQIKMVCTFCLYYGMINNTRYFMFSRLREVIIHNGKNIGLDNISGIVDINETNNLCKYYGIKTFKQQFKAEFLDYSIFKSFFNEFFNFRNSNYNYYYEYVPTNRFNNISLMENAVFVIHSICLDFTLTVYHEYNTKIKTYSVEILFNNKSKIDDLLKEIIKWFKNKYDEVWYELNNDVILFSGLNCEILRSNGHLKRDIEPSFILQLTHLIDEYEIKDLMLPD